MAQSQGLTWNFGTRILGGKPSGFLVREDPTDEVVCIIPRNKRTQGDCEDIARQIVTAHNAKIACSPVNWGD